MTRGELLLGAAEAHCKLHQAQAASPLLIEAIRLLGVGGRPGRRRSARSTGCRTVHMALDDPEEARRLLLEMVGNGPDVVEDPDFEVRLRIALAQIETEHGDPARGALYLEEARDLAGSLDLRKRGVYFDALSKARFEANDTEGAIRAATEALTLFRASEQEVQEAQLENALAMSFVRLGNLARADELAAHAVAIAERLHHHQTLGHYLDTQATIRLARGDLNGRAGADRAGARDRGRARAGQRPGRRPDHARAGPHARRAGPTRPRWPGPTPRRSPASSRRRSAGAGSSRPGPSPRAPGPPRRGLRGHARGDLTGRRSVTAPPGRPSRSPRTAKPADSTPALRQPAAMRTRGAVGGTKSPAKADSAPMTYASPAPAQPGRPRARRRGIGPAATMGLVLFGVLACSAASSAPASRCATYASLIAGPARPDAARDDRAARAVGRATTGPARWSWPGSASSTAQVVTFDQTPAGARRRHDGRSRTARSGRTPASTRSASSPPASTPSAAGPRGASTITQQLVRQRLLTDEQRGRDRGHRDAAS